MKERRSCHVADAREEKRRGRNRALSAGSGSKGGRKMKERRSRRETRCRRREEEGGGAYRTSMQRKVRKLAEKSSPVTAATRFRLWVWMLSGLYARCRGLPSPSLAPLRARCLDAEREGEGLQTLEEGEAVWMLSPSPSRARCLNTGREGEGLQTPEEGEGDGLQAAETFLQTPAVRDGRGWIAREGGERGRLAAESRARCLAGDGKHLKDSRALPVHTRKLPRHAGDDLTHARGWMQYFEEYLENLSHADGCGSDHRPR